MGIQTTPAYVGSTLTGHGRWPLCLVAGHFVVWLCKSPSFPLLTAGLGPPVHTWLDRDGGCSFSAA